LIADDVHIFLNTILIFFVVVVFPFAGVGILHDAWVKTGSF